MKRVLEELEGMRAETNRTRKRLTMSEKRIPRLERA
jgi:hypothetical protein